MGRVIDTLPYLRNRVLSERVRGKSNSPDCTFRRFILPPGQVRARARGCAGVVHAVRLARARVSPASDVPKVDMRCLIWS